MLSEILPRLSHHPVLAKARDALAANNLTALYDMPPSLRLLFALAMARERPVIYLLPNERAARQAYEDAIGLQAQDVVYFQQADLRFMRAVTGLESQWQRIAALTKIISGEGKRLSAPLTRCKRTCRRGLAGAVHAHHQAWRGIPARGPGAEFALLGYERVDLVEGRPVCPARDILTSTRPPWTCPRALSFLMYRWTATACLTP